MNEQTVWAWLWINAKPLYYIAGKTHIIGFFIWLGLVAPTDEVSIAESQNNGGEMFEYSKQKEIKKQQRKKLREHIELIALFLVVGLLVCVPFIPLKYNPIIIKILSVLLIIGLVVITLHYLKKSK